MENTSLSYGPQMFNSNVPEYMCTWGPNHFNKQTIIIMALGRLHLHGSVNIPALRTVQCHGSFGYTGSKYCNSLPLNLKSIREYRYFKREIK